MAPNPKANQLAGSYTKSDDQNIGRNKDFLERTVSDLTWELNQQGMEQDEEGALVLQAASIKCECCGMSEECSEEYINDVRHRFWGKFICGLCGEAVNETLQQKKNGGKRGIKEAVEEHMNACVKFNEMVRSYPVLYQAEAIKQILKKASRSRPSSSSRSTVTPSDSKSGTIVRSSSCIPDINHAAVTINDVAS